MRELRADFDQSVRSLFLLISFALLFPAPSLVGQIVSQHLGQPVAWEVLYEGPEYMISGVVLTLTGDPVETAIVRLEGVSVGAMTDASGRFELRAPSPGEWVIDILGIPAPRVRETLTVPAGSNVRMVVMLTTRVPLCGLRVCIGTGCEDLKIRVLDAETGKPPDAKVTLRLEHESGVRTVSRRLSATDPDLTRFLGLGEPVRTVGFHNIEVTAPGYAPWRIERVWLEPTKECHPILIGRRHEARLEPKRR